MLKKYKLNVIFEAFQWDGSIKQLRKYKWMREAFETCKLFADLRNMSGDKFPPIYDISYADDIEKIDSITAGDYIVYYRKENVIVLYKRKDFLRNMIEVK
jgi:hypothetical protein